MSATKTKPAAKWTVTSYPQPNGKMKVIAVSPDRIRVMHVEGLTAEEVKRFDPPAKWAEQAFKGIKGKVAR